ncbi:general transcription factor II-I repeat domain-containing protein 2-like [Hypanus sabinus]|uniref:general transcription factor II-I repeat domain-containing protein 2-like n=1 Tax=Hypanus sabinus TaxID=79690 RepID=UPI0028C4853A|nr:general transcription factor II-I repeat domain-containing protein 2-like [Hypanus sabinus]
MNPTESELRKIQDDATTVSMPMNLRPNESKQVLVLTSVPLDGRHIGPSNNHAAQRKHVRDESTGPTTTVFVVNLSAKASDTTTTRRVELIDEDITSDLNKKAESFTLYSLALDESNDVKDTAQLLIFIRGINNTFEITEEFLTMESLKGKTRGEDLYDRVSAVIENMKLPWSKLINVTTDGSPNLTGKNVGLLRRIQNKVKAENPDQDVIFLHCIIHQESLCKSVLQLNHVVNPVVKLVNFIRARGLQHRQFITFLEETDADHQDLLYHSRVRWLSLGKVFQRVWELKEEIGAFLELLRKAGEFPELSNKSWLCDFAFAVDIFSHMNELNVKLQGKDQFVHDMFTNVKAFKSKLAFFSRQILNKLFTHFPTLATLEEAGANGK